MAAAGLGEDLLLANETLDPTRLAAMAAAQDTATVTVAVDSDATDRARPRRPASATCSIDVNVGLPRCGCAPEDAGRLADLARARGLDVRGVMGYEGHLMMVDDRGEQRAKVDEAMDRLLAAHALVGGDIVSAGGTGTYDLHDRVTEVQAGSYALMDTLLRPARAAVRAGVLGRRHRDLGEPEARRRRRRPEGARHGPRQPVDRRRDGVVLQRRARHVRAAQRVAGRRPGAGHPGAHRPDDGDARARPGSSAATTSSTAGRSTSAAGDVERVASDAARSRSAPDDGRERDTGGQSPRSSSSSARKARPRWPIACFSSSVISLNVRRVAVGDEQRVEAPAAPATLRLGDRAVADAVARRPRSRRARRPSRRSGSAPSASGGSESGERVEQLGPVLGVRRVRAGEVRGVDAGLAVERVDLQPGVVGDRRQPGRGARAPPPSAGRCPRACPSPRRRRARRPGAAAARPTSSEDRRDLGDLVRVRRRADELQHALIGEAAGGSAIISACSAMICSMPAWPRSSSASSCARPNGAASAVPCTSTNSGSPPRPSASITTFMSTSAVESSTYGRSSTGTPFTMPTLIAAQNECSGCSLDRLRDARAGVSASCSAR